MPPASDATVLNDLQISLKKKNEELENYSSRIQEFELSLAHAQKTIGTLTDELDRRKALIEKLERDREQPKSEYPQIQGAADIQSPGFFLLNSLTIAYHS